MASRKSARLSNSDGGLRSSASPASSDNDDPDYKFNEEEATVGESEPEEDASLLDTAEILEHFNSHTLEGVWDGLLDMTRYWKIHFPGGDCVGIADVLRRSDSAKRDLYDAILTAAIEAYNK